MSTLLQADFLGTRQTGEITSVNRCPICKDGYDLVARVPTINKNSQISVELRECVNCRHWWHSPIPNQITLNQLYAENSPFVVDFGGRVGYPEKHSLDGFARFAMRSAKPASDTCKSYLELGIGGGYLLRRFDALGYCCTGVDPGNKVDSPHMFPTCDALPEGMRFSLIVLQDVLEHVRNPVELLRDLRGRTAPQATIVCSFPLKDSRLARVRKERWRMILPFGHLHYFSRNSTHEAFSRAGWRLNTLRRAHPASLLSLFASGRIPTLAHELLQRGKDQAYVDASAI